MSQESSNATQLLIQARQGDQNACMQLLFHRHATLSAFVASQIGDSLRAALSVDDILQETFVVAIREVTKLREDNLDAFHAWLQKIAANRVRDAARRAQSAKRGGNRHRVERTAHASRSIAGDLLAELAGPEATPSHAAASREAIHAMRIAIATLPDEQRQAIQLHCFDGLTLEETADRMQRTWDSIRGLLQRAKRNLRDRMDRSSLWLSR